MIMHPELRKFIEFVNTPKQEVAVDENIDEEFQKLREQLLEAEAAIEALAEYAEKQYEISLKEQIDKSLVFVTAPLPDIDEKILIKKYYPVLQRAPPKL